MDIVFQTDKFADECNAIKALTRRYSTDNAKRIRRCLDDLRAAANLDTPPPPAALIGASPSRSKQPRSARDRVPADAGVCGIGSR